jgi:flagellar hook-associated protein 2
MSDSLFKVGGLISGLDVKSIISAMVKAESYRLDDIKKKQDYVLIERNVYKSIGDLVTQLKDLLFQIKMMNTYLTPKATSSNPSLLYVTAKSGASFGTYNVKISQLAQPSIAISNYVRLFTTSSTVGDFSVSGRSAENIEGIDTINIKSVTGGYELDWSFKPKNLPSVNAYMGSVIEDAANAGKVGVNVAAGSVFNFTYGGKSLQFSFSNSYTSGVSSMYDLAREIEDKMNEAINSAFGTKDYTYVMVRVETSGAPGTAKLVVYDMTGSGLSFSGSTVSTLGLLNPSVELRDSVTTKFFAAGLSDVVNAIGNYFIPGASVSGTNVSDGAIEVLRDASLKAQKAIYSYVYGAKVSSGAGLNLNATLDKAGFAVTPTVSTNGYFTINGVKIYIDDYTKLTVNDILARINSAGAGVLAYYDSVNDRIVLRSVTPGGPIKLGSPQDTSNFLTVGKLAITSGATYVPGATEGKIDPTVPLASSGLSITPTKGTFTINGVTLYVDPAKDSLMDLLNRIKNSPSGVDAYYDSNLDKVVIVNKSNSNNSYITLGSPNDTSNILSALNLIPTGTSTYQVGKKGQDAIINVNGINFIRPTNEISDVINGVTLYLKGVVGENYVTVTLAPDEEALLDKFSQMIVLYNQIVDKLNPPKLTDDMKKYLEPLSDEDKAKMTQAEIDDYKKKHEEYLSYKIISESRELRDFLYKLRSNLTATVNNSGFFKSLFDIGLMDDYGMSEDEKNKGYILGKYTDKDKIKELLRNNSRFMDALRNRPYDLYKLFVGDREDGIAKKLYNVVNNYFGTSGLVYNYYKPGGSIDAIIARLTKNEVEEVNRLNEYESMLWNKFSAMEESMAKMQAASQYLMAQLGINNNNK